MSSYVPVACDHPTIPGSLTSVLCQWRTMSPACTYVMSSYPQYGRPLPFVVGAAGQINRQIRVFARSAHPSRRVTPPAKSGSLGSVRMEAFAALGDDAP